jgi:hypothetical protein
MTEVVRYEASISVAAEAARQAAEQARTSAESARASAEEARRDEERTRVVRDSLRGKSLWRRLLVALRSR